MPDSKTLQQLVPTFKVGTEEYESTLAEDLFINRTDLSGEFARHAERYAFYATCFELASMRVEQYKAAQQKLYAILDQEKRGELANSGVKTTEKVVENKILMDDRYVAIQEELLDAQGQMGVLKAAMVSMQHRKDMLIQLGSAARAEMAADVSMKAGFTRG
jgi:hypothetical protein